MKWMIWNGSRSFICNDVTEALSDLEHLTAMRVALNVALEALEEINDDRINEDKNWIQAQANIAELLARTGEMVIAARSEILAEIAEEEV